jgi:hypothetical protein
MERGNAEREEWETGRRQLRRREGEEGMGRGTHISGALMLIRNKARHIWEVRDFTSAKGNCYET